MKKLIVVGNGFDLFHGLKTTYYNFRSYLLENKYNDFIYKLEKYNLQDNLWSELENALGNINYEGLTDDNSSYLISPDSDEWRDSANHDYQLSLRIALQYHEDIEELLLKWILSIDTQIATKFQGKLLNSRNKYLVFNYTDTLSSGYGIHGNDACYIHGKANNGEGLILGHGNTEYFHDPARVELNNYEEDMYYTENAYSEDIRVIEGEEVIRQYFIATYKDTEYTIQKHKAFFDDLKEVKEIFVIGHSISYADIPYFKLIDSKLPTVNWCVSYYGTEEDSRRKDKLELKQKLMSVGILEDRITMISIEDMSVI